jgi:hypothetical protein
MLPLTRSKSCSLLLVELPEPPIPFIGLISTWGSVVRLEKELGCLNLPCIADLSDEKLQNVRENVKTYCENSAKYFF